MHLPRLYKLLALFISGSILISSVPVYAAGTTSLIEPDISEEFEDPDDAADNPDEDVIGSFADDDMAVESRADLVDENRETPSGSDSESERYAASIEEGNVDSNFDTDTNTGDTDTSGDSDTTGDSDTSDEKDGDSATVQKKESFAHQFHNDDNDSAYNELRKELDEIFQNAHLQDTTDLPGNYSLVSLPFGGEGPGGSADRSAPIKAAQGRDMLMPVYNQGVTMNTCWSFTGTGIIESYLIRNQYDKLGGQGIELSKWQVPVASSKTVSEDTVFGGYHVAPSQYGEGISIELNGGGSPSTYGQLVTSWAGLDYEKNAPTPRDKNKITELTPVQIDRAVVRGRDALFLLSPTPNMIGHDGYDKNMDPAEAVVYDPAAVAAIKNCLMKVRPGICRNLLPGG